MNNTLLSCRNITKSFGDDIAIKNLSLDLNNGEILSVLGPSGCGKTTLLRLIAGLEMPDAGSLTLENRPIFDNKINIPTHKRGMGMVFQEYALFPHLTVNQNILFGIRNLVKQERTERLKSLLDLTRLGHLVSRFPHELSGGEQQRVALARTLAPAPSLLLMDEPFSNLDSSLRSSVRLEILDILRDTETSTIFVTHDREEAFSISDKVAVIFNGRLHQVDTPDKIYFWPTTHEVATIGGLCDFVEGTVRKGIVDTQVGSLPYRKTGELQDGTKEIVAIRPNDLQMSASPDGKHRVIRKEFRGDDTIFWVRSPNGEVVRCKHKIYTTLFEGIKVNLAAEEHVIFNIFDQ